MARAWGPRLQQVVGVPVSPSRGSGVGQKMRVVGGGSIKKLACALRGCNVVLSPLGARRSTGGTLVPDTYSICSGGRWWAWFPRAGVRGCGCLCVLRKTDRMPFLILPGTKWPQPGFYPNGRQN